MQLAIYKALTDIEVSEDEATAIVEAMQDFIKSQVSIEARETLAEVKAGNRLMTIGFSLVGLLVTLGGIASQVFP